MRGPRSRIPRRWEARTSIAWQMEQLSISFLCIRCIVRHGLPPPVLLRVRSRPCARRRRIGCARRRREADRSSSQRERRDEPFCDLHGGTLSVNFCKTMTKVRAYSTKICGDTFSSSPHDAGVGRDSLSRRGSRIVPLNRATPSLPIGSGPPSPPSEGERDGVRGPLVDDSNASFMGRIEERGCSPA